MSPGKAPKKRARGRPKKPLKAQSLDRQIARLAGRLTVAQLADFFEMGEDTFRKRLQEEPVLFRAYKKGRARGIEDVARSLVTQAKSGNVTAQIFYLKTQGGWRERLVVEDFDPNALTDEQLEAIERGEPVEKVLARAAREERRI